MKMKFYYLSLSALFIFLQSCDNEEQEQIETNVVEDSLVETVVEEIGRIAKPEKIQFVSGLPKTRSGKIMRRILRKIAEGTADQLGDTSTLLDPDVVEEIKAGYLK